METLPNFIKRKHPRKGEKKKQGGKGLLFSSLSVKNRVHVRQTRHGHQGSGTK
jgi:hypothetical protein